MGTMLTTPTSEPKPLPSNMTTPSSKTSSVDQKSLESKLEKALDAAWTKINEALDKASEPSAIFAMEIWFAAEGLEYSSLLFNLSYGLEDLNPTGKPRKHEAAKVHITDSMDLLKSARHVRHQADTDD